MSPPRLKARFADDVPDSSEEPPGSPEKSEESDSSDTPTVIRQAREGSGIHKPSKERKGVRQVAEDISSNANLDAADPEGKCNSHMNMRRKSLAAQSDSRSRKTSFASSYSGITRDGAGQEAVEEEHFFACDEDPTTGSLRPIRIRVYPFAFMRRHPVVTTYVIVGVIAVLVLFSVATEIFLFVMERVAD